jgi:voltage-gated potassium channel Kch
VLLAESRFRHQLEADIEPFRGILLGLFFMSVGMSIDASLVVREWPLLAVATPAVLLVKLALVTVLVRLFDTPWPEAARAGAVLSAAGEFGFVVLPLAASLGLLAGHLAQLATALAALTMLGGPLLAKGIDLALDKARRRRPEPEPDAFEDSAGRVLVIGFGRFGQAVNQVLLAQGVDVTVIDKEVEQIRNAAQFGFRVYYGDGTRRDVLQAAGAAKAEIVCVCVDDRKTALTIVDLVHEFFPQARSFVRAYDRIHAIELMKRDVDHQTRELFESALAFGRATLEELGVAPEAVARVVEDVRKRDVARLVMQKAQGLMAGADLLHGARLKPEPLTAPRARPKALSPETRDIIGQDPS